MDQAVLQKWEYHVEDFNSASRVNESLSRLGAEGWELVSVVGGNSADAAGPVKTLRRKNDTFRAFFKRPGD